MIEKGEKVVLWSPDQICLCEVDGETKRITGIGIIDTGRLEGKELGSSIKLGDTTYYLLDPSLKNADDLIDRGPQVIQPEMAGQMAHYCDIGCGDTVIEGGAGSGLLAAVLAQRVGEEGKVVSYEIRDDFLRLAERNLERLGLKRSWTGKNGDITKDVEEKDVDAFMVDIPEPWEALDMAEESLKPGSPFCAYVPSTNQLEQTVRVLRERDYIDIKAFEKMERDMIVTEKGIRPSFEGLGHTGYVAIGHKTP